MKLCYNIIVHSEITHGFWPGEGFYRGGLTGSLLLSGRGSVNFQYPVGQVDMLHMEHNQTHNVLSSSNHYARTFTVLGFQLRIKATPVVRITGRVWEKKNLKSRILVSVNVDISNFMLHVQKVIYETIKIFQNWHMVTNTQTTVLGAFDP